MNAKACPLAILVASLGCERAAAACGVDPCAQTTSIAASFDARGPIRFGESQNALSGWTYARAGIAPGLLSGITSTLWSGTAWGSESLAFYVPLAGPRYSPTPALNGNPYYRRLPSFDGIMLHPGFGADFAQAVLSPQNDSVLYSLKLEAEHLGSASPDAYVTVYLRRSSGAITTLIASTRIASLALATTTHLTNLSLAIGATDKIIVESSDGGNAAEDWLNVNVTAELSGPPMIEVQPLARANCEQSSAVIRIINAPPSPGVIGPTFRWRRNGVPIFDGPTGTGSTLSGAASATLTISNVNTLDEAAYDCVVTNFCGTTTTDSTLLRLCLADFNCDGFVDGFDYDDFVLCFEGGACPPGKTADFNGDGFPDGFDYDEFVAEFETGCE